MKKIVLLCSAGMSTAILVKKMQESAKEEAYDVEISAHSFNDLKRVGPEADLILLGPQVRFNLSFVQKKLPDKPVEVIDMRDYGTMNGQAVLKRAREILEDEC